MRLLLVRLVVGSHFVVMCTCTEACARRIQSLSQSSHHAHAYMVIEINEQASGCISPHIYLSITIACSHDTHNHDQHSFMFNSSTFAKRYTE